MQTHENQAAPAEPIGAAEQPTPRARRVHVPNDYLGRVLDHGRASAYAIHLLAEKLRSGHVLNRKQVAKERGAGGLGMSKRAFTAGMSVLTTAGPLKRWQRGRRRDGRKAFAQERLAPSGTRYVGLSEGLILEQPSKVVRGGHTPQPQSPACR
jgi:hypothetical protein